VEGLALHRKLNPALVAPDYEVGAAKAVGHTKLTSMIAYAR